MRSKTPFTLGTDPELFYSNGSKIVAVPDFLDDEFMEEDDFNFFADNALLEYNTRVVTSKDEFVKHNREVYDFIANFMEKNHNLYPSMAIDHTFESSELTHPLCEEFGCQPDMNAYKGKENPKPDITKVGGYRVAGGHIHIGYQNEKKSTSLLLIKNLDATLGAWSVLKEAPNSRRQQYGQAGSYRRLEGIKVEYRTLSNFWIHDDKAAELVFDLIDYAVWVTIDKGINLEDSRIIDAINNRDLEVCEEILTNSLTDEKLLKCLIQYTPMQTLPSTKKVLL